MDVRGEDEGVVQDPLHGGPGLGRPVPELVANFIFLSWKVLCSDFLLLPEEGEVTIEVNTLRVESGSGSGKSEVRFKCNIVTHYWAWVQREALCLFSRVLWKPSGLRVGRR